MGRSKSWPWLRTGSFAGWMQQHSYLGGQSSGKSQVIPHAVWGPTFFALAQLAL